MKRDLEKSKAWRRRSKPLKRGGRLKPFGRRAKRGRESGEVFGPLCDHVREMACLACEAPGPSDPHHVKSRGAGYADWLSHRNGNVVPLCRACHDSYTRLDQEWLRFWAWKIGKGFELKERRPSHGA